MYSVQRNIYRCDGDRRVISRQASAYEIVIELLLQREIQKDSYG